MDKKSTLLDSKLAKYSALATGAIAMSNAANSQIVHTDLNPDVTLTGNDSYDVDFDSDMNIDVQLYTLSTTGATGSFTSGGQTFTYVANFYQAGVVTPSASPNSWVQDGSSNLANMAAGNMISSGNSFQAGQGDGAIVIDAMINGSIPFSYSTGAFLGADGFIGVSFDISGSTHYGWVRVEMGSDAKSLIVKEFAYNGQANGGIQAGQTTGIENQDISGFVSVRNGLDNIIVENAGQLTNATINITNLAGQTVKSINMTDARTDINTAELSTGVYMVNILANEGMMAKKVYVR